jgi:hypothetical protein
VRDEVAQGQGLLVKGDEWVLLPVLRLHPVGGSWWLSREGENHTCIVAAWLVIPEQGRRGNLGLG